MKHEKIRSAFFSDAANACLIALLFPYSRKVFFAVDKFEKGWKIKRRNFPSGWISKLWPRHSSRFPEWSFQQPALIGPINALSKAKRLKVRENRGEKFSQLIFKSRTNIRSQKGRRTLDFLSFPPRSPRSSHLLHKGLLTRPLQPFSKTLQRYKACVSRGQGVLLLKSNSNKCVK